jgi:hypothetical protein
VTLLSHRVLWLYTRKNSKARCHNTFCSSRCSFGQQRKRPRSATTKRWFVPLQESEKHSLAGKNPSHIKRMVCDVVWDERL